MFEVLALLIGSIVLILIGIVIICFVGWHLILIGMSYLGNIQDFNNMKSMMYNENTVLNNKSYCTYFITYVNGKKREYEFESESISINHYHVHDDFGLNKGHCFVLWLHSIYASMKKKGIQGSKKLEISHILNEEVKISDEMKEFIFEEKGYSKRYIKDNPDKDLYIVRDSVYYGEEGNYGDRLKFGPYIDFYLRFESKNKSLKTEKPDEPATAEPAST